MVAFGDSVASANMQKKSAPGSRQMCLQCFDTVGWAAGRASGL